MNTEKALLRQMRKTLKWNDGDDDSFQKYKSFYSVMKMNATLRNEYLNDVENDYLLDMYVWKFKRAWSFYTQLAMLDSVNKHRYEKQLEKLQSIIEIIV